MTYEPLTYAVVAAAGPVAAAVANSPAAIMDGAATSVTGVLVLVMWKLANAITLHLREVERHRQLEVSQWESQTAHRAAEREHWRGDGPHRDNSLAASER